jgi:hypothetical protein
MSPPPKSPQPMRPRLLTILQLWKRLRPKPSLKTKLKKLWLKKPQQKAPEEINHESLFTQA